MSQMMQLIFAVLFAILPECQNHEDVNCKSTHNPYGYDTVWLDVPTTGNKDILMMQGEFHDGPGLKSYKDFPRPKYKANTDY